MSAIDTVVGRAVNPGAAFTAATMATGDSLTVRNFPFPAGSCWLTDVIRSGAAEGYARVRSPLMHDFVRGIAFKTVLQPTVYAMPQEYAQVLRPQDTLTLEITGGGAETDIAILTLYYDQLPGAVARLHSWGDIAGLIKNIKPLEVDVTNSATAGAWTDTVITTTEDLTHANTDYAVLGYITDIHQGVVAVKGIDTGNLRVGGPGINRYESTSDYFVQKSNRLGKPCIPVISSANKGGTFVSTADDTASSTPVISLVLAELSQNLPN